MTDITTRETSGGGATVKGSPLTNSEVDTNFINLNTDKVEVSGAIIFVAKAGEALSKGDVVYVSGVSGNEPVVSKADANDASKMPAYGLAEADANLNAAVNVVTFGTLYDLNTSSFAAGDTVYVSTTAGAITTTAPTGESSLLQNIGTVIRSHASAGSIKVGGAGRTNATPNLNDGNVFIGNASNQAEARALVEADISDLQAYLTSVSVDGLSDATITAVADNEVLAYDSTSSEWINQTAAEAGLATSAQGSLADSALQNVVEDTTPQLGGNLDFNGNIATSFSSTGIDDNATINRLTVSNSGVDIGGLVTGGAFIVDGTPYGIGAGGQLTSTGIDDNATSTAITIDSSNDVSISGDLTVDTNTLYVDSTNNEVGIGTVTPATKFEIYENTADAALTVSSSAASGFDTLLNFRLTGSTIWSMGLDNSDGDKFKIGRGGTLNNLSNPYLTINDSGNVGIGTSPNVILETNVASGNNEFRQDVAGTARGQLISSATDQYLVNLGSGSQLFYTGGSERLHITSGGNVGIGTSPSHRLHVSANVTSDDLVYFNNENAVASDVLRLNTLGAGSGTKVLDCQVAGVSKFVVNGLGNVGINENSPDSLLHLKSSSPDIILEDSDNASAIGSSNRVRFRNSSGTYSAQIGNDPSIDSGANFTLGTLVGYPVGIMTNGSTKMLIGTNGNVGIGVADPDAKLEISLADNDTSTYFHGGGFRGLKINDETISNSGDHTKFNKSTSTGTYSFNNNNGELLRINYDGNVGIGVTSPTNGKLSVDGTINITDTAGTYAAGALGYTDSNWGFLHRPPRAGAIGAHAFQSFAGSTLMSVTDSGNVGIGISPSFKVHVSGADGMQHFIQGGTGAISESAYYVAQGRALFGYDAGNVLISDNAASKPIVFECGGSERARIDTSGNVGIGTASPSKTLHVVATEGTVPSSSGLGMISLIQNNSTTTSSSGIGILGGTGANSSVFFSDADDADVGAIVYEHNNNAMAFKANAAERMRIDSSGNVGIGTSSPSSKLHVRDSLRVSTTGTGDGSTDGTLLAVGTLGEAYLYNYEAQPLIFATNATERMRIDSSGNLLVGTTTVSFNSKANVVSGLNGIYAATTTSGSGYTAAVFERTAADGELVSFLQGGTTEGSVSVSGTTVSYNGGHLSRWSQSDKDDVSLLYKGTVMSNLDEMCEWDNEDNEQLNKTKVSDVEGDVNVAGVFVAEDNSDDLSDYYLAMTGDMIIRIAQGTTVQRGDLLISAGDGTAKPQDDDIVRSKTIAKVTSTNVTCTYADGSYCVPCVLMAC